MSDLISRQAAIVALANNRCGNDEWDLAVTHDVETIKKLSPIKPGKDCISREAVKKILDNGWKSGVYPSAGSIDALPSVEPERKTGKWYWFGRLRTCSNCDKSYGGDGIYYFCPNCGADMREVQDG